MFRIAFRFFIAMLLLTGFVYPLLITLIAQLTMPKQASGSLIYEGEVPQGSELIAQAFTSERYFWPRPSAADYNPLHSKGTNLGPISKKLKTQINQRIQVLNATNPANFLIPPDLIYSSASGLDPHISPEAAYFQLDRVAKARSLNTTEIHSLRQLIEQLIEGKSGILGPTYLNVLLLNKAMDEHFSKQSQ